MPTIGVEFQTKTLSIPEEEKSDKLVSISAQIWDTSGSERYRSVVVGHYRAAVGALLVFDITDRDTFEQCDHWLKELRDNCSEHCQVVLVANKIDLASDDPQERQVGYDEAVAYAKENDLIFMGETSAKENINIKEVFENLLCKVHWKQRVVQEQKKVEAWRLG